MKLIFSEHAWEDCLCWQRPDRKILQRINTLIQEIQRASFAGIGKPEPLTHVEASGGNNECIRTVQGRCFNRRRNPTNIGTVAAGQGLSRREHRFRHIYRINVIHQGREGARNKASATAGIEDSALHDG